ncbi:DUF4139 domain-containing protein [Persicobacter sp. CCB-QB2]|uniref:DUF4139 domain-containing protein n=1 Tax=Persicobacter sp. CCB-QB2 TaxID=1561025 RepID=UPI0006A9E2F7|nr:DUF4139 domain-containing protein [Persicobacter sp. CCB-QB2]
MKYLSNLLLFLFLSTPLLAQEISSKISKVDLFESGATIHRKAIKSLSKGEHEIIFTGISQGVEEASIQLASSGQVLIKGVRFDYDYKTDKIRLQQQNYTDSLFLLQDQREELEFELESLKKQQEILKQNSQQAGNEHRSTEEIKQLLQYYAQKDADLFRAINKTRQAQQQAKAVFQDFLRRNNKGSYYITSGAVIVNLEAFQAVKATFDLNYRVSATGWETQYDIRIKDIQSPVQLVHKAEIYQSTGADWKQVPLTLVTGNANSNQQLATLNPWYLRENQPSKIMVRGAATQMMELDIDLDYEEEAVDEDFEVKAKAPAMHQYTKTTTNVIQTDFSIEKPTTILSEKMNGYVELAQYELTADYQFKVVPKENTSAFLIATLFDWGDHPLLKGPSQNYFGGRYVGQGYIDPAVSDTLVISLGVSPQIQCSRKELKQNKSKRVLGGKVRESRLYQIEVRNNGQNTAKVAVEDQLPVSQNGKIVVKPTELSGAVHDAFSGKLKWEFELAPGAKKTIQLGFEVEYPKGFSVDGL